MLFRTLLARSATPISFQSPRGRATNDAGFPIKLPGNIPKESVKNRTTLNPARTVKTTATATLPVGMRPTTAPFLDEASRDYRCFHQGTWYRPGQEISKGQVLNWCFGSYCDYDGLVKQWDDVHCQFSINRSNNSSTTIKSPVFFQSKTAFVRPPTTQMVPTTTAGLGCEYRNKWYWPGETASYEQIGTVCYGYNCDLNSRLVYFEEFCAPTASPAYDATTLFTKK
ncbi:hypothetical protein CHS0354_026084 [Potamilus streckersoni]|uniref:Uncharacterized protein n=1 Tax=Potamilus streckersoni TaxID=2493646 RepID=A0AAE0SJ30_9BIVA|nr:hypothetical protein CHS0354_026084 [Potamilus streckersoni]